MSLQVAARVTGPLDLHEYLGGANIMPTTPHPITNEKVPLTLGHEFSGVIEEVGEDVQDIKVGARVTVQPIIYDGTCGACKEGYINCCDSNGFIGLSGNFPATDQSHRIAEPNRLGWWALRSCGSTAKVGVPAPGQCFTGGCRWVAYLCNPVSLG